MTRFSRLCRRVGTLGLTTAFATSLALVPAPSSLAAGLNIHACDGSGSLNVGSTAPYTWQIQGTGTCYAPGVLPARPPLAVTFTGSGTSSSLGLCSSTLLVTNLVLNVTVTFTNTATGEQTVVQEVWYAPITTFPLATPFIVSTTPSGFAGLGVTFTRIFLSCGNSGNEPSATFLWAQDF